MVQGSVENPHDKAPRARRPGSNANVSRGTKLGRPGRGTAWRALDPPSSATRFHLCTAIGVTPS
jgi:hypothetical protein